MAQRNLNCFKKSSKRSYLLCLSVLTFNLIRLVNLTYLRINSKVDTFFQENACVANKENAFTKKNGERENRKV